MKTLNFGSAFFMASATRYEEQLELADKEYERALSEISVRLFEWAGIDPKYADPEVELPKRLTRKKNIWLPEKETKAFREIVFHFYDEMGPIAPFELGIAGWEYGICQMFDISKSSVCKTLPFLLIAYMYNFHSNGFVLDYIQALKKRHIKKMGPEDIIQALKTLKKRRIKNIDLEYILGVKKLIKATEYSEDLGDANGKHKQVVGIEKLLREKVSNPGRMREELILLAARFKFPEIVQIKLPVPFPGFFGEMLPFFVPEKSEAQFKRECRAHKIYTMESDPIFMDGPPISPCCYGQQDLYRLFCTLYVVISRCAEKSPDCFAAKPDPLLCWLLFTGAIEDNEKIETTKSDCENMSNEDLGKDLDTFIRSIHDPQTTKKDSPKQIPIFKNSVPFPEKETNAMVDAFIDFIKNQPEAIRISYKNLIDGIQQALSKIIPPES